MRRTGEAGTLENVDYGRRCGDFTCHRNLSNRMRYPGQFHAPPLRHAQEKQFLDQGKPSGFA
jgi:hypothetical protein